MLTEVCQYLRNWFDRNQPKFYGDFAIRDAKLFFDGADMAGLLKDGQYIRIVDSTLNDGVYKFPDELEMLSPEEFTGSVWGMAVPLEVISLAEDIEKWQSKYGDIESAAMSPYNSESFSGYSYSKSTGTYSGSGESQAGTWQGVFRARLNLWRKIK